MPERKNIFLIGRQGHRGDENQLTEMLAFLWQEQPDLVGEWLETIGVSGRGDWTVETQLVTPSGKRPDVVLTGDDSVVLVESKLGSTLSETQIPDYLEFLEAQRHSTRVLVVITQLPEAVKEEFKTQASDAGIDMISTRWQALAESLGEAGAGSLGGDFVQMLIREGLVTPTKLTMADWQAWNRGYEVLLRLDALLVEATAAMQARVPSLAAATSGNTKRWIYRLWKSRDFEIGLGFGAAYSDNKPDGTPIIFSQAINRNAGGKEAARSAIGNSRWEALEGAPQGAYGLLWGEWPTRTMDAADVLTSEDFRGQVEDAVNFVLETVEFLQSVGYLPARLGPPAATV
jgi:hypothetical protein